MRKNEKVVRLALRLGYNNLSDIIDQTGLGKKTIEASLVELCHAYGVPDAAHLAAILAPQQQQSEPKYTSHDCVIVDAALSPEQAAYLLYQVLGKHYCEALKIAL